MKILLVVPYFNEPHRWMISGQKTAFELAKNHQVTVVTTGKQAAVENPIPSLKIVRVKDYFIPDPVNYSFVPSLFKEVSRIVREENPDGFIINKHMFFTSLAIWTLKRLGKKVIVQTDTFPGINWFPKSKMVGIVMWVYARLIGNPILRAADKVVLLHDDLVEPARKLGLNYEVIHNGIDLEEFDKAQTPTDLVKPANETWVGYVGRLESVKGWYDLAAVAKEVVKRNDNVKFFFIGPNENADTSQFAHPQIRFLGSRKDVAGIDKLLDIFVMPSYSEGLSNALMEAMSAGCACVVTAVGGNIVLVEDGSSGLVFKPGDTGRLKDHLEMLLADDSLRNKLGKAARKKIIEEFSLSVNVNKLAERLTTDK